jgi:hypothetical protein
MDMGQRSGITSRGYQPNIFAMHRAMELREQLQAENETRMDRAMQVRQLRKSYWYGRLANAMTDLKAIDPEGWEAWFDDDANVPAIISHKDLALLVEQHLQDLLAGLQRPLQRATAKLYKGVFIWVDTRGAFMFSDSGRILDFVNADEARAHVDAALALSQHIGVYANA